MVMNSIDSITGKFTSLLGGGAKQAPAKAGYFTSMVPEKGDATLYGTEALFIVQLKLCVVGIKHRVWEYTVAAQQALCWGFGSALTPDNQGYVFFGVMDKTVEFDEGTILLEHENHARHKTIPVAEFNSGATHEPDFLDLTTWRSTNKKQLYALPERTDLEVVGQDSRLVIDFTLISGTVANIENARFDIPCTVYD